MRITASMNEAKFERITFHEVNQLKFLIFHRDKIYNILYEKYIYTYIYRLDTTHSRKFCYILRVRFLKVVVV